MITREKFTKGQFNVKHTNRKDHPVLVFLRDRSKYAFTVREIKEKTKMNEDTVRSMMAKVKITLEGFKCERCKHEWVPRNKGTPAVCPKCKSPYWNRPRRKKNNKKPR